MNKERIFLAELWDMGFLILPTEVIGLFFRAENSSMIVWKKRDSSIIGVKKFWIVRIFGFSGGRCIKIWEENERASFERKKLMED